MRRLAATLLALSTAGFVPPKSTVPPEIAGEFEAEGVHPSGEAYRGRATLTRLGGDRYEITFHMPNGVFRAICVRDAELLGCAWGLARDLGVAFYRPKGPSLVGGWFSDGDLALGRERIDVGDAGSDGVFALDGLDPGGTAYTGKLTSSPFAKGVRRLSWDRDGTPVWGWGIAEGGALVGAFPSSRAGAAIYRILGGGGRLEGIWMDFSTPALGVGSETLLRD